mmetsp:Transcript_45531/g.95598  ORF Transcript_45531/g.95598 Transcript_45531/m.95598 type:complete len:345 (-) Transcript_45531:364-1398(-)
MVGNNGIKCSGRQTCRTNDLHLGRRVRFELVDRHYHLHTKLSGVFNMFHEVATSGRNQGYVFLSVFFGEGFACRDRWASSMHFEGTHGGNDYGTFWFEARFAAFDIEEFLHTNISTKSCLRNHISTITHQLQRQSIRHNTRIPNRNIRKRSRMDQHRRPFHRLHQRRQQRILHQHRQGSTASQIIRRDRFPRFRIAHHHGPKLFAQIGQIFGKRQYRHDFRCHRNIKPRIPRVLFPRCFALDGSPWLNRLLGTNPHGNLAQVSIAYVQHTLPRDGGLIKIQSCKFRSFLGCQIIGRFFGIDSQFDQSSFHNGTKRFAIGQTQSLIQRLVGLGIFMKHACINRRG